MPRERSLKVGERHPSTGVPVRGKLTVKERFFLMAEARLRRGLGQRALNTVGKPKKR